MRKITRLLFHNALLLSLLYCSAITVNAQMIFIVNSTADTPVDGCTPTTTTNGCTLREAVAAANASIGTLDTVNFDQSIFSSGGTINLLLGEIIISDNIIIAQSTTATGLVTIVGAGEPDGQRIFTIAAGADTTLTRLALAKGYSASSDGGAIFNNNGTLTINTSIIRDSFAGGSRGGGGIFNNGGTVNITNSTIGGIPVAPALGSNEAGSGGGIYNLNGTVNLTNTTISGNRANSGFGGGYYGFAAVELGNPNPTTTLSARNATVANNFAPNGGGIAVSSAVGLSTANINNTIVGDNSASGTGPDLFSQGVVAGVGGTIVSSGYNLIENISGSNIVMNTADQFGVPPLLLPLAANNALTPTHALQNSGSFQSPAIDKGNSALSVPNITMDQRGFPRPIDFVNIAPAPGGNNSDIGAYELQLGATSASVTVGGRVITSVGRGVSRARVKVTDSNGVSRTASTNFFGYFRFQDLAAGETYIFNVSAKSHSFAPQIVTVVEDITELNFIAQP